MKALIHSYHAGNGLTVWRPGGETLAWVSPTREVQYKAKVSSIEKQAIEKLAATDNRTVSVTQEQRVFSVPPKRYRG